GGLGNMRRFRAADRVTEATQTVLGDVENQLALADMVFRQTLQVILDAGNGIGQGVEVLPVGNGLMSQQLFLDIAVAGIQQGCGAGQGYHAQTATYLGQQLRNASQVLMIPLRGDELDDGVLGYFQAGAGHVKTQYV